MTSCSYASPQRRTILESGPRGQYVERPGSLCGIREDDERTCKNTTCIQSGLVGANAIVRTWPSLPNNQIPMKPSLGPDSWVLQGCCQRLDPIRDIRWEVMSLNPLQRSTFGLRARTMIVRPAARTLEPPATWYILSQIRDQRKGPPPSGGAHSDTFVMQDRE